MRSVHIGIDVGGTFTKAVALDGRDLLGQATVLTTHQAPEGVAAGVVRVLERLLRETGLDPAGIALVAHSTTQATNALLEGDWSTIGIIAMGPARDRAKVLRRANPKGADLAPGKRLDTVTRFLATDGGLSAEAVEAALAELVAAGCRTIVASEAFSVEDPSREREVVDAARRRGLPATAGSDLTGVYGLEVRTTTAAINASILPRMIETAEMVEQSLEGMVSAPLLILKGDGGVATMETFRSQPLLTLFSGPAAGLAGALKLRPLLHGLFLEVGGTSTNIGLARDGQVALRYVRVGDFPTCVRAADVRVVGVAGGSLPRLRGGRIETVGPRSAHIAGLPYSAFTPPDEIVDPELVLFSPRPGDPGDYAAIRTRAGRMIALTPTCAANALATVPDGDYARGNPEAARRAFAPLAQYLGGSVEEAARRLLAQASRQIEAPIRDLLREHRVALPETSLLVGGGGAAALGQTVAARLGIRMERVPHAEVISSIGAALAMVRIEREQALAHPSSEALAALREEVELAGFEMGASPDTLTIQMEFIPERGAVRVIATGSLAFSPNGIRVLPEAELRALAARAVGVRETEVSRRLSTPVYLVFEAPARRGLWRHATRAVVVVDRKGAVPLVLDRCEVVVGPPQAVLDAVTQALSGRRGRWGLAPEVRIVRGNRLVDLSPFTATEPLLRALSRELGEGPEGERVAALVA